MKTTGMNLAWIVVSDFEKGVKFYTEVLGLELLSKCTENYKWAELKGKSGAMIGISEHAEFSSIAPGGNAVLTYSVENIEKAIEDLKESSVELIGQLQVVPGHVKLQLFKDEDGNIGQLAEML